MQKVVIASNNSGKLKEIHQLLAPLGMEIIPQSKLGVTEIEEPYGTFVENALTKARHASRITGLAALADDSGLCVNILGGAPGVLSARYAGEPKSDERNNQKLADILKNQSDRRAYYYCIIVLVRHADDPQPIIADGSWHGGIVLEPRGKGGFGYDPYFFLPDWNQTAAELPLEQKNQISHRGKALRKLSEMIAITRR